KDHPKASLAGERMLKKEQRLMGFLFACGFMLLGLCAAASRVPGQIVGSISGSDPRLETFEIVWRTIKEKHFDPTLGGLNWDKVREQYAPKVAAAKNDREFYDILDQMIGELHQSHFRVFPPGSFPESESKAPESGGIGISIMMLDGKPVITRVDPGSRAAEAGLRPGFIIQKVDGLDVNLITGVVPTGKQTTAIVRLRMS